ncbi:MAG: hypothetical protein VX777_02515 [Chlamydiota bacterium]|nr:hypothetical protein [Chlamydiota bacterium]
MHMLRLNRDENNRNVSISYKKKDSLFTSTFIFAFTFALLTHTLPLYVFNISSINLNYPKLVLPPVTVQTDDLPHNKFNENNTSSNLDQRIIAKRNALIPPFSKVELPKISDYQGDVNTIFPPHHFQISHLFDDYENAVFLTNNNPISIVTIHPAYEINAFGSLSESLPPIISEKKISAPASQIEKKRLIFSTIVDNESGKVIWIENVSKLKNKKLIKKATELLNDLKFNITKGTLFTYGDIEITFTMALNN